MAKQFYISTTERQQFKRCRRQWKYGSYNAMALTPIRPAPALWIGTGVHHALASYYAHGTLPDVAWRKWVLAETEKLAERTGAELWLEEEVKLAETCEFYAKLLQRYHEYSTEFDEFKVIDVEMQFSQPIPTPEGETDSCNTTLVGRVDGLIEIAGEYWILEHKTAAEAPNEKFLAIDDQSTCYMWGVQESFGVKIAGVLHNNLIKKLPSEPRLLKSGKLSKDRSAVTTAEVYSRAVTAHDLDLAEYAEHIAWLAALPERFFLRYWLRRSPEKLATIERQLYYEALDMQRGALYPTPTRDCAFMCDYYTLCVQEDNGIGLEASIEQQYSQRTPEGVYKGEISKGGWLNGIVPQVKKRRSFIRARGTERSARVDS